MEDTRKVGSQTFHDYDEALMCLALHPGAEIIAEEGHPVVLGSGKVVYPYPEARPSWTVGWEGDDVLVLTYVGRDSWNRPVYESAGRLYVDTDPRKDRAPDIYTMSENTIDGEPDIPIPDGMEFKFIPKRYTVLVLTYVGRDGWNRPVYECAGKLYVDTDPRNDSAPEICTKSENAFDGEPDIPIPNGTEVKFIPERDTWD